MDLRFRHFEKTKDPAGCRTSAQLWEKLKRDDADTLYDAACFRAATAAVVQAADKSRKPQAAATAEADRAMTWLQQEAVAAGYKNVAHMKQDTDLDALRDREDYRKLVMQLEGGKKN